MAVQADLDAAVADGLDQERADEAMERLTEWLDDGGELGPFGGFGRVGPGHHVFGPGPFHGPWGDDGGSDDGADDGEDAAGA